MAPANLKTLVTLVFFTGYISVTTAQTPNQQPDPLLKSEHDRLSYDIQHGREAPNVNGISYKESRTISTGSSGKTIRDFFKNVNVDKAGGNGNETETGKSLISKYSADAEQG